MGNTHNLFKRLALIGTLLLASCASTPTAPPSVPMAESMEKPAASSTSLKAVVENTKSNLADIQRDATTVLASSKKAINVLDPVYESSQGSAKIAVDAALDTFKEIDAKADNILEAVRDIHREADKLQNLTAEVDKLENKLLKLSSALEITKGKALEKLYGYITMFWVIGFAMLAVGGAVAFFLNKTYGASICLLGILMLGFASASQYYMEEIALVGAILLIAGFLAGIGMISWELIKGKRTDEAIKEVVEIIEILKESMTDSEKERIFGATGVVTHIQSDFTKQLVAKIRERNGFKALKEVKAQNASTEQDPKQPA